MGIKAKGLSVVFLAVVASGVWTAGSASAIPIGHFVADATHNTWKGTNTGALPVLKWQGESGEPIECTHVHVTGTVGKQTVNRVILKTVYTGCKTRGTEFHSVSIDTSECGHGLDSAGTNAQGTASIECPAGKSIVITHPNCTISIPAQTSAGLTGGVSYTTTVESGKHALVADTAIGDIDAHYEGGICVFLGTNHKFTLNGAFALWGTDAAGERVGITHT